MQLATVAMLATLTNAVAKVPTDFVVPHFVEVMSVSARHCHVPVERRRTRRVYVH